ncbi:MAG: hypothetical protein LBS19_09670 [Clostridiales bacterium]|jgi:hypothetical protein|nr:hypothetical protein [Clostridiales bacterium]
MKKAKKINDGIIMAIVAVFLIILFGGAFNFVTDAVFAAAMKKSAALSPNPSPFVYKLPEISMAAEDGVNSDTPFFIMEQGIEFKPENASSPQQAVAIGAKYVEEALGEKIDGLTVAIRYYYQHAYNRTQLCGQVIPSGLGYGPKDMAHEMRDVTLFLFSLDAVTGERISIDDARVQDITMTGFWSADIIKQIEEELLRGVDMSELTLLAIECAEKHFAFTETVSCEYAAISKRTFGVPLDKDGNITTAAESMSILSDNALEFSVVDERGREAVVSILAKTKRLFSINTSHNDIVPGWNSGN